MKGISKLKDEARKHEQREEWDKAVKAYLQVLADAESGEIELPLYNRVGDLYARLGRQEEAVHYYEQAADRYAEAGLYNNAIALCNKALRYAPGRLHVLRRLGQYSASQGFLTDARSYLMQYAEKSFAAGDHDATFAVLADYARISGDAEIRGYCGHKLHELGRNDEAVAELKRAYALRMGVGDVEAAATLRREILAIEPSALDDEFTSGAIPMPPQPMVLPVPAEELPDLLEEPPPRPFVPGAPARAVAPPQPTLPESDELTPEAGLLDGFQATMLDLGGDQADIGQLPDLEPATEFEPAAIELPRLEDLEAAAEPEADAALLPDLQLPNLSQAAGLEHMGPPAGFEFPALAEELEPEPQPLSGLMSAPVPEEPEAFEDATPLPVLEEPEEFEDATPLPGLEEPETFEDSTPLPVLEEPETFEDTTPLPVLEEPEEFEDATPLPVLEEPEAFEDATPLPELEELEPVEDASPLPLLDEGGQADSPEPVGFVDLRSLVIEPPGPAVGTRFTVDEQVPTGDEDGDFAELLSQFKRKVAESVGPEDAAAHYDLGLAFKDMGLLDEAISELQIALQAGDMRLKVIEELGHCFLLKKEYGIAEKVLRRALETKHNDELELLGVYYHLGRTYEELGKPELARDAYERVLALDFNFGDVSERIARL